MPRNANGAQRSGEKSSSSGGGSSSSSSSGSDNNPAAGSGSIALHRSARKWLEGCVNSSTIETALPSSEYWRERRSFLFYKHLHCVIHRYAASASSALDVGSSLPPFINSLSWVQKRTILGPRFAGNVAKGGGEILSLPRIESKFGVTAISADFLEWMPPGWPGSALGAAAPGAAAPSPLFDLVLCSEVVEHVPRPAEFVRKLLLVGRLLVLSVPYMWEACDNTKCHHKTNKITRQKIEAWAGRPPLAFDVVEELSGDRRIIAVWQHQVAVGAVAAPADTMHSFTF